VFALREDVAAVMGRPARPVDVIVWLLTARGTQSLALYRLAHWCASRRLLPFALLVTRLNHLLFCVDISYRAQIAPGCILDGPDSIVIGADAQLERGVRVARGITLGKRLSGGPGRPDGMPHVEEGCHLSAGVVLLGPIVVGAGSHIGEYVVLARSVESGSVVHNAVPAPLRPQDLHFVA
jgi:serine O-acetyltransferase